MLATPPSYILEPIIPGARLCEFVPPQHSANLYAMHCSQSIFVVIQALKGEFTMIGQGDVANSPKLDPCPCSLYFLQHSRRWHRFQPPEYGHGHGASGKSSCRTIRTVPTRTWVHVESRVSHTAASHPEQMRGFSWCAQQAVAVLKTPEQSLYCRTHSVIIGSWHGFLAPMYIFKVITIVPYHCFSVRRQKLHVVYRRVVSH